MPDLNISTVLRLESSAYIASIRAASVATGELSAAIKLVNANMRRTATAAAEATTAIDRHTLGITRMETTALRAAGAQRSLANAAVRAGSSFDSGGIRKMENAVIGVSAVLGGFGAIAIKSAIEFESAFTGVLKTVEGTEQQLATLRESILDISTTVPTSASDIASVAEAAGQLGIQTDNVADFTKTMIDLGESTDLSADEAAKSLARFFEIMQGSANEYDNLGSTIVDLGNNFATTESEIVDMSTRLAAAGKTVGFSAAGVLSLSTALSSVGVRAERGGTAMQKVLFDINAAVLEGGQKLSQFADIAGVSAEEFARRWQETPEEAFNTFIQGIGRMQAAGANIAGALDDVELSGERVQQSLVSLGSAGDLFTNTLERGNTAWEQNSALATEAGRRYATTESQLRIFGNTLRRELIEIGTEKLPQILALLERNADTLPELFQALADSGVNLLEALANGLPVLETLGRLLAAIPPDLLALATTFSVISKVGRGVTGAIAPITGALRGVSKAQSGITGGSAATAAAGGPLGVALAAAAAIAISSYTTAMAKAEERTQQTAAGLKSFSTGLSDAIEQGKSLNQLNLEGIGEQEFDLGGVDRNSSFLGQLKDASTGNVITKISQLIEDVDTLAGGYEITDELLKNAGVSQEQFVQTALAGGPAVDSLAAKIGGFAGEAGKAFRNAENSAKDLANSIREDTGEAFDKLVTDAEVTSIAIARIREANTPQETELQLQASFDPEAREIVYQQVEVQVDGVENLRRSTEDVIFATTQMDNLALAAENLGIKAPQVASFVAAAAIDESGLVNYERARDLIYAVDDASDEIDFSTFSAETLEAVGAAVALSDESDKVAAAITALNEIQANPDLGAWFQLQAAFQAIGVDIFDVAEQVPALGDLMVESFGAGTGAVAGVGAAYKGAGDDLSELAQITQDYAALQAGVDAAIAGTSSAFEEYGYTAQTVASALSGVEKVSAEAGEALFQILPEVEAHRLAIGLLEGDYEIAAQAASQLALSEQQLADVQAALTQRVLETSAAYSNAFIPTVSSALKAYQSSLKTTLGSAGSTVSAGGGTGGATRSYTPVKVEEPDYELIGDRAAAGVKTVGSKIDDEIREIINSGEARFDDISGRWFLPLAGGGRKWLDEAKEQAKDFEDGFGIMAAAIRTGRAKFDTESGRWYAVTPDGGKQWLTQANEDAYKIQAGWGALEQAKKEGRARFDAVEGKWWIAKRDPKTGEITEEAEEIVQKIDEGFISIEQAWATGRARYEGGFWKLDDKIIAWAPNEDVGKVGTGGRVDYSPQFEQLGVDYLAPGAEELFKQADMDELARERERARADAIDKARADFNKERRQQRVQAAVAEEKAQAEEAVGSIGGFLEQFRQEQLAAFKFTGQIGDFQVGGLDDLADIIVELGETAPDVARAFASEVEGVGASSAREYELLVEATKVGTIALERQVQEQSNKLADTDNQVLVGIREGHQGTLDFLKGVWGEDYDEIIQTVLDGYEEIEEKVNPPRSALAGEALLRQYGTSLEDVLLLLEQGGVDTLNQDLVKSLLLLDGFSDNEIQRMFEDLEDEPAVLSGIVADALQELDLITQQERDQIVFVQFDKNQYEGSLADAKADMDKWAADRKNFVIIGTEVIGGGSGQDRLDEILGNYNIEPSVFHKVARYGPKFLPEDFTRTLLSAGGLDEEEIEILLNGDDEDLSRALQDAYGKLKGWEGYESKAKLGVDDSELDTQIDSAVARANARADREPIIIQSEVQPPTTNSVRQVLDRIDASVRAASGGKFGIDDLPAAGSGAGPFADGGIVQFAKGGVSDAPHIAQIASPGAWRLWAEPETGGEAYIPLSPAKRGRSLAILEEVAKRFGMGLMDQANSRDFAVQQFAQGGVFGAQPIRMPEGSTAGIQKITSITTTNQPHVSFDGDMRFEDPERAVEYAQRRMRMNALTGSGAR